MISFKLSLFIKFLILVSIFLFDRKWEMLDCCGFCFKFFVVVKESFGGKNGWKLVYLISKKYRK